MNPLLLLLGSYLSFKLLWCCGCSLVLTVLYSYPDSSCSFYVSVLLKLYSYPNSFCSFMFLWCCSCTLTLIHFAVFMFLCYWSCICFLILLQFHVSVLLQLYSYSDPFFRFYVSVLLKLYSYPNSFVLFFSVMFLCICSCTRSWLCPAFSSSIPPPAWISRYPANLYVDTSKLGFYWLLLNGKSHLIFGFIFCLLKISSRGLYFGRKRIFIPL